MKRMNIVCASALLCLGATSLAAYAAQVENKTQIKVEPQKSVEEQKEKLNALKQTVNAEVKNGLDKVGRAVTLLDQSKPEDALKLLKEAVGSFDIALGADPKLNMVPVSSVVQVHELYSDPKAIQGQILRSVDLLNNGRIQEARQLLMPLQNDITETVTYLPMATYPAAIRASVKEIVDGNIDQAKATLAGAMNTLVVSDVRVVPIPLLAARSLIDEASKMDKKNKSDVRERLTQAKQQLEIARLLGYQHDSSDQYKKTKEDIEKLENEIEGANKVEKLYADLKASITSWIDLIGKQFSPVKSKG